MMQIHTKTLGDGIAIIKLDGKLNMVSAPHLREEVHSAVAAGNTKVAVDLLDVSFIDSSGLGALINGLKATRQAGGDLRIASPAEQVRLVLELTNIDRVLKAYDNAETAFSD